MNTKESFLSILSSVNREGVPKLTSYLEGSTFFEDPASADWHNAYEGGLAEHSLNVYHTLDKLSSLKSDHTSLNDSIKLIGLLCDVSLIGTFQKVTKNVTVKGSDGKNKRREDGRILFVEKEVFEHVSETHLPYPHGQTSLMLIKQYLKLTKLEDLAIFWHHSLQEPPTPLSTRAQKTHWLVLSAAYADLESKHFLGDRPSAPRDPEKT